MKEEDVFDRIEKFYIKEAREILRMGGVNPDNMAFAVETDKFYYLIQAHSEDVFRILLKLYQKNPIELVKLVEYLDKQPKFPLMITFMRLPKY